MGEVRASTSVEPLPGADRRHRVVVLALDRVVALDLTIATHVFAHDHRGRYDVVVASVDGRAVRTSTGFTLGADHDVSAVRGADTVIVPGYARAAVAAPVLDALRGAAARGARVASICTGAFALAEAGLLDGRRATTHWVHAEDLAREHPRVTVDPAVLYVDEGPVLTSAGVAAGFDLCLHMVARDHGRAAATERARHLVTPVHRAGGQAQYVPPAPLRLTARTGAPADGGPDLAAAASWALEHLGQVITVDQLARRAVTSPRTLHRAFAAATGTTPTRWLAAQRLRAACRLLEAPGVTVEQVAARCGFGTTTTFRARFRAAYGTTPTAYRAAFHGDPAQDVRS